MRWAGRLGSLASAACDTASGAADIARATRRRKHATPKRGKTLSIPFFSSPPHCHPIFSCSWSCVYTASLGQGGDGGFCSAPTRSVLRQALDTEAAGREAATAALMWPQTFMLSLKNVTLWRRSRLARHKLTAKNYKSHVDRAREAEGASNTRPRVALRSCSAGDAARKLHQVGFIRRSICALILSEQIYFLSAQLYTLSALNIFLRAQIDSERSQNKCLSKEYMTCF